ncbi:MAG: flavin reductase [Acutalibacter sp.]|nr:flavin reductase [Acutalibacter sp.]
MKPAVLKNLPNSICAIGVRDGKRYNACIASSVMQVSKATSSVPPLVAVSLNKANHTSECIEKTGMFTISVLSQDSPAQVIGALGLVSGKKADKLENVRHKVLAEGVPVIKERTCCWFLCNVKEKIEIAGQRLFLAEVVAGSDEAVGVPMTYQYYVEHLRGSAPLKSPTYLPPESTAERSSGESFVCSVCGYVYSDPHTSFEELPEDWVCPICKMPKKAFVRKS